MVKVGRWGKMGKVVEGGRDFFFFLAGTFLCAMFFERNLLKGETD